MGNDGARSILDALATNRSLTSVKLSGNKVRVKALKLSNYFRSIKGRRRVYEAEMRGCPTKLWTLVK